MARVDSGDGTLGKLLSDDTLYNKLTSVSANLDSLFVDIKRNPRRYVQLSIFGRKN